MVASITGKAVLADPVDDSLQIDGTEIITRAPAPEGLPFDQVLSGWLFREAETRATEADSFANPGMLAVERGAEIWNTVEGTMGKSCASCHQDAAKTMKDVGAHYPKWDAASGKPLNVELRINKCRVDNMGAEPYKFDDPNQLALTSYIKHQSLGTPVGIDLSQGQMQSWWDRGKELYYTRTGQLNLACASCHEGATGKYIRADHLSQGQVNGFPTYRFNTAGMVSLHNRFRGCIRDTRAEMPAAFSDELMALEVYVTWRGTGLSVETPSVRQ
ncbi:sulfur oxidation c-type cytochrome SoxA [Mesorhizobium sp. 1M-11]|uniref:sulfur oxidation c-type cytochrome SoxA n=1 Tax=Mesorhizobium sp. 1M-11 TaxID=1529006 RepID=UPI001FCD5039|nr:sulfur oxidation c-type cytochrome SoxA [Mesorhizobium sp. 1M-11]